eukprot:TRINITY_DN17346_c0_g2_i1.p1 TRINITY_DN17346_c0_g2~~TRINITY_DN17346_c0_g2_i1.p1  ORF type:complete len:175 (+),score=49.48 TRINITY_DN17346_c0_g2_i1:58-582(+)
MMSGPPPNLSEYKPIDSEQTVAMINSFIWHTAKLLNKLSTTSETKLLDIADRISKLENNVILLESQLSSVPKRTAKAPSQQQQPVQQQSTQPQPTNTTATQESNTETQNVDETNKQEVTEAVEPDVVEEEEPAIDPRYERFQKMLKMQVPHGAVIHKMMMEEPDLDPAVIGLSF